MSIEALNWAFNLPITGPRKGVLIALANYADHRGRVSRLSMRRICLFSGWGERTVQIAMLEMTCAEATDKKDRIVGPIASRESNGGRGRTADYVLDLKYQAPNTPTGDSEHAPNPACDAPYPHLNPACDAPFDAETPHVMRPFEQSNPAPGAPFRSETPHLMSKTPHEIRPLLKIPKKERKEERECVAVRKRTTRARLAPDWQPDEAGREYAASRNVPIASEVESFRDYHLGKGTLIADSAAAWRTWCRKAVVFAARQPRRPAFRNGFLASIAEHGFEHASDDDSPVARVLRLNGGRVYGRS